MMQQNIFLSLNLLFSYFSNIEFGTGFEHDLAYRREITKFLSSIKWPDQTNFELISDFVKGNH